LCNHLPWKSNAKAIKNAIFQAIEFNNSQVNVAIEELLIKNIR